MIQKERLAWSLSEDSKASQFTSYTISGGKAKVSIKLRRLESDWDISFERSSLSIFMIASDDFYSDKQYLIRVGMNYNSNKK